MSRNLSSLFLVVSFILVTTVPVPAQTTKPECPIAMPLHHMHSVLDHGLIMVLQGSDLVMLSSMKASPAVDDIIKAHGYAMIAEGKSLIKETLSGTEMKKMHEQGYWSDALMAYTHQLGAEILALVDDAEQMKIGDTSSCAISIHHIHLALNHAVKMAAEGANLVMLGKMGVAGSVEHNTVSHGRKMIADGRKLWDSILNGQAMKELNALGSTREMAKLVMQTQKMVKHGDRMLALLDKMATLPY